MAKKNKIISTHVGVMIEPIQEPTKPELIPSKTETDNVRVSFYGSGTICPIIKGKRVIIRFLPEHNNIFTTGKLEIIEWLRANSYREKVKA